MASSVYVLVRRDDLVWGGAAWGLTRGSSGSSLGWGINSISEFFPLAYLILFRWLRESDPNETLVVGNLKPGQDAVYAYLGIIKAAKISTSGFKE